MIHLFTLCWWALGALIYWEDCRKYKEPLGDCFICLMAATCLGPIAWFLVRHVRNKISNR